jgi:hypothetical protein
MADTELTPPSTPPPQCPFGTTRFSNSSSSRSQHLAVRGRPSVRPLTPRPRPTGCHVCGGAVVTSLARGLTAMNHPERVMSRGVEPRG